MIHAPIRTKNRLHDLLAKSPGGLVIAVDSDLADAARHLAAQGAVFIRSFRAEDGDRLIVHPAGTANGELFSPAQAMSMADGGGR